VAILEVSEIRECREEDSEGSMEVLGARIEGILTADIIECIYQI